MPPAKGCFLYNKGDTGETHIRQEKTKALPSDRQAFITAVCILSVETVGQIKYDKCHIGTQIGDIVLNYREICGKIYRI